MGFLQQLMFNYENTTQPPESLFQDVSGLWTLKPKLHGLSSLFRFEILIHPRWTWDLRHPMPDRSTTMNCWWIPRAQNLSSSASCLSPTILVEISFFAAQKSTQNPDEQQQNDHFLLVKSLRACILPPFGDGSKPYPPGEHQNSWWMDVHPTKNGMYRYWSIAICLQIFAENSRGPGDDRRRRAASPGGFRQPWQPWQGWGRWGRWGNGTSGAVPNFLGDIPTNDTGQTWANYNSLNWNIRLLLGIMPITNPMVIMIPGFGHDVRSL